MSYCQSCAAIQRELHHLRQALGDERRELNDRIADERAARLAAESRAATAERERDEWREACRRERGDV